MLSKIALKLYALKKADKIKTNFQFWESIYDADFLNTMEVDEKTYDLELKNNNLNLICAFDDDFQNFNIIKPSERPFLFVYKGDINLLTQVENNVAIIGVLSPTNEIISREKKVVQKLIDENLTIVSGLARGCDTIAHQTCIKNGGKTIAILPTTFENIYPKENACLVDEIVESGGLVISEYVAKPKDRFERTRRFIERDRLQAMLSKAVVLVASFRHREGDSGSRHAMQKAKEYDRKRLVMFNQKTDLGNPMFGLNKNLLKENDVIILTENSIKELLL